MKTNLRRNLSQIFKFLLKYGGIIILSIIVYVSFFIMFPLKIFGSWESVAIPHIGVLIFFWVLYGLGAYDNSAD